MAQEVLAYKTADDWAVDIADVIYKMHQSGIPYGEILRVVDRIRKQLDVMDYTENWTKQFNPAGLDTFSRRPE